MNKKSIKENWIYYALPLAGFLFVFWYVRAAACDMPYSDYIRQIISYLPDVWNPEKFFVADILTRIPVNFPVRAFNVEVLGFSVLFDLMLGAAGLGLAGVFLGGYSRRRKLHTGWFLWLMLLFFSLNKWEMLTNGTGWVHFLAFACFYYHYIVFDRMESGEGKKGDHIRMMALPFFITLCVAGPYCAVYTGTLLLAFGFCGARKRILTKKWDKRYGQYAVCTLIPLFLYMWSSSFAVTEHAGAYDGPVLPVLLEQPMLFVKFFIKSFAGMAVGQEAFEDLVNKGLIPYACVYGLGLLVMMAYAVGLWLNFRYELYKETILPLMLIIAGGMNHVLILMSRWIFLRDSYGMSSRYALQFQVGILGIVLTAGLLWDRLKGKWIRIAAAAWCVIMLAGNFYTTEREIRIAHNRKEWGMTVEEMARDYNSYDDDELKTWFQYKDPERIRRALKILEDNHLNVFRN